MKLSIVIPVYNTREYLAACLGSVLDPDAEDYEIVIVNDGSTDDSGQLAAEYVGRFPERIRLITTENGGLGAARNVGLEAAQGDFVFFLDSDDALSPGALPEMLEALTPERDIVIFDFLSVDQSGRVLERLPRCARTGALSLKEYPQLIREYPSGCNKLCRRSLFLDSGIRFPGRVWYEDLRTMPKLYPLTDRIWSTGKAWYRYLVRPGSITKGAALERNLEIIDAVDDLLGYYRAQGLYEQYADELEYVAFYNLFLTASVRVCLGDPDSPVLPALRKAWTTRFPDFRHSGWYRSLPKKYLLLTKLLFAGQYRAVAALMRLREKSK